jgi:hypothetical protein
MVGKLCNARSAMPRLVTWLVVGGARHGIWRLSLRRIDAEIAKIYRFDNAQISPLAAAKKVAVLTALRAGMEPVETKTDSGTVVVNVLPVVSGTFLTEAAVRELSDCGRLPRDSVIQLTPPIDSDQTTISTPMTIAQARAVIDDAGLKYPALEKPVFEPSTVAPIVELEEPREQPSKVIRWPRSPAEASSID